MSIGHSQTMLRTPSGPSTDGGSDRQKRLQIYRPVAIMWNLGVLDMLPNIPGTHTVRETSRRSRYGRWLQPFQKSIKKQGCYIKG